MTRRRRVPRPPGPAAAILLLTTALVVGAYGGVVSVLRLGVDVEPPTAGIPAAPPAALAEPAEDGAPLPVFASSDAVALRLVSPDVVAVAFHEASYEDATALRPIGVCRVCRNRWKFRPPPPRRGDLFYIVTDTRGRPTAATSAVDLVLPEDAPVLSPVTGTVTAVKRYRLYARYPDVRLTIRPDAATDRRVVLLHLAGVRLRPGDRVEASVSRIGAVRAFAFRSQVDRYVPGRNPHVHIEVKDPAADRHAKTKP